MKVNNKWKWKWVQKLKEKKNEQKAMERSGYEGLDIAVPVLYIYVHVFAA